MCFLHDDENQSEKILQYLQELQKPVILYGASDCGKAYYDILTKKGIEIECFCDDDRIKQQKLFCGKKVMDSRYLCGGDEPIIISSWGPLKILRKLRTMDEKIAQRCIILDLYLWEDGLDYYTYYKSNEDKINQAYQLLYDEKSKKVFSNLLQYKINREPSLIQEIQDDVRLQYFDSDIMTFTNKEIFLDLGAYNGDTALSFISNVDEQYKKIIALEPDHDNYMMLLRNTKMFSDIECHCLGIDSASRKIHFRADSTWTSRVAQDGIDEIQTTSVDELLKDERVSFIKADIEGMETAMLIGAENTIRRDVPKLAIAAYHRKEDIFNLICMLHEYSDKYIFYLRHYTELPIDTVLYAIKSNK